VRLAEAFRETLVRLLYGGFIHGKSRGSVCSSARVFMLTSPVDGREAFDRPSTFPDLQASRSVIQCHWVHGDLQWIPASLTTLNPATSPRLSKIYLGFSAQCTRASFTTSWVHEAGEVGHRPPTDRGRIYRIEREYGGAVDLAMSRHYRVRTVGYS